MTAELTLTEHRRPPGTNRYRVATFTPDTRFTHGWWTPNYYSDEANYIQISVQAGDIEVARVELDQTIDYSHYTSAPNLGRQALEIQFIDVAADHRNRGIGTTVVHLLTDAYPERRLVAFSEEADGFWASLGWDRHLHPEGGTHYRPLFVQPAT